MICFKKIYVRPKNFQQFDAVRYNLPIKLTAKSSYAQQQDILCAYMYSQRSCSHPVASILQCSWLQCAILIWSTIASYDELYMDFSQSEMKNYSERIVIHLSGAYTGDTENKSRFFSKNPAYRYTYRNCSFTPKSLT